MKLNIAKRFLNGLMVNRKIIMQMAIKDLKDKYLGSYLGILWAIIQPTISIMIFWFIFQIAFNSQPIENYPYILWLIAGIVPWFFFSDALMNGTNSILSNIFLVKNVAFQVSVLPIVKIISSLFIHLFFLLFTIVMFWAYGFAPNIYFLQVVYYLFAMFCLLLGISWITSSLVIFFKDVGQILSMILQLGYWITPILWSLNMIPPKYSLIMKLNPMYYIVEGYRNSFIFRSWFWQYPIQTLYFWGVTLFLLILGSLIFKRLRPHFSDVL